LELVEGTSPVPKPTKAELIAKDLCGDCEEIGIFLGVSPQQAAYRCRNRVVPAWKECGRWKLRPSRYQRHVEEQENATLHQA
jgi:hypothetical protein